MTQTHIWWIRRDIRLSDNQALDAALQGAERLVPLFIIEPDLMANAAPARRSFLLGALGNLDQSLQSLGSRLIVRSGPARHRPAGVIE
jgi:deoxyribodipyrimidine photo-lyase